MATKRSRDEEKYTWDREPKRSFVVLEKRKRAIDDEEDGTYSRRSSYCFKASSKDIIQQKDAEIMALKAELEGYKKRERVYTQQFQRLHAELQRCMSSGGYTESYVHYVDAF